MFVTPAHAQTAGGAGMADPFITFLPLVFIFIIFYFLLIRPQQKRQNEHKAMVEALRRGDQVITSGGVYGKVAKVREDGDLEVEIAEGVRIRVVKTTIMQVVSKTEPVKVEKGG
ncbi:MAG: preprotein translocase subunit YajC [Pseudomonadota bacterium]